MWRADGDRSPEEWLARQTGASKADAGRLVDTGRQLEALPVVAEAAARGELSARQAEAIAGAAAADPGAQSRLVGKAKGASLRELQDECRRTRANAETDPDAAARRAHAKRSCRTWTDADGVTGHLHLSGPVAEMARVDNAVRHRADQTFRPARAAGPAGARRGLRLRRRGRAAHRTGGWRDPHRRGRTPRSSCGSTTPPSCAVAPSRARPVRSPASARPGRHGAGVARRRLRRRRAHQG